MQIETQIKRQGQPQKLEPDALRPVVTWKTK